MSDTDYNQMALEQRTISAMIDLRKAAAADQPPELCMAAVSVHPSYALGWIHEQNQTYAMCLMAVTANHAMLRYVAARLMTAELCEVAVESWLRRRKGKNNTCSCSVSTRYAYCSCACPLQWIPAEFQTSEMCMSALKHSAAAFQYIQNKTPEQSLLAIQTSNVAHCISLITDPTPEMCEIAVSRNAMALEYIQESNQTPDMCRMAVEREPRTIQFVKNQTPELCRMAVERDPRTIQFVKDQTPDLCEFAMRKNPDVIEFISAAGQTVAVLALVPLKKRKFIKHRYYVRRSYVYKCVAGKEDVCIGCLEGESESDSSSRSDKS